MLASGATGQCQGGVFNLCLLSEKQLFFLLLYFSFSAGCYPLRHGDCKAGATSLLQGSGIVAGVGAGRGGWAGVPSRLFSFSTAPFPTQGLLPAGIRLMPHTVLTFVFLEQLRKHFGIKVPS